jgi:hypothetical protein
MTTQPHEQCPICHGAGVYCVGTSGQERDGNAPILERCECLYDVPEELNCDHCYGEGGDRMCDFILPCPKCGK